MPARGERLRRRSDFRRIITGTRPWSSSVAALYVERNDTGGRRVGFSASRRLGGAVVRNRAKRLFREAYNGLRCCIADGVSMVFIIRPPATRMEFGQIKAAMRDLLAHAGVLARDHEKARERGP